MLLGLNAKIMKKSHVRNYGLDLLKILSMCAIVGLHVINQGGIYQAAYQLGKTRYASVVALGNFFYLSVDIFAMITGYLTCEYESIKLKSLLKLWGITYFYIFAVLGLFKFCGLGDVKSLEEYVYVLFPMTKGRYWYLICYSFVFLLTPYLNKLVNNLSNSEFKKLVVSMLILGSFFPTIGMTDFFRLNNGYSASWLIICYLLGVYIKKFGVVIQLKRKCIVILFNMLLGTVLPVFIRHFWSDYLKILFAEYSELLFMQYISPLIVINAVLIVSIFSEINCSKDENPLLSKIVQKTSTATFGVYVLHIHVLIFDHYMKDSFVWITRYNSVSMCIMIIGSVAGIFLVCCVVEMVRHEMTSIIVRAVIMMTNRSLPILYSRKEECCGCMACVAVCPQETISIVEDEEGFEYPMVNEKNCIKCYMCLKVCPIKNAQTGNRITVQTAQAQRYE